MGANEIEISDHFWAVNADFGPTAFTYASLDEMTADADLIVVGRVVGTRMAGPAPVDDPGGEVPRPVRFGVIAIDEVLKGWPNMLDAGVVLVNRLSAQDETVGGLPPEQFVIFLKNYEQLQAEFGKGLFNDASDRFYYVRPNGYQAVLRNINGVLTVVEGLDGEALAPGAFPALLDGQPFDDVLEAIRQAVAAG